MYSIMFLGLNVDEGAIETVKNLTRRPMNLSTPRCVWWTFIVLQARYLLVGQLLLLADTHTTVW